MPLPFLKSSSSSTVPPPRPPSPLSAANSLSISSRTKRPSTSTASISSRDRERRASSSRGVSTTSLIPQTQAQTPKPLKSRLIATPAPIPSIPPPTSQSSRSLSSRLLRRRPSEKNNLRSLRVPTLLGAASESDGPSEPLTGSTTGPDVFASQQDTGMGGPIMSAEERRESIGDRQNDSPISIQPKRESAEWSSRMEQVRPQTIEWNAFYAPTADSPNMIKAGFTALPPPPRKGSRKISKIEPEIEIGGFGPRPTPIIQDIWGRRSSEPSNPLAMIESMELPKGHPFQSDYNYVPRVVSASSSRTSEKSDKGVGLGRSNSEKNRFGDAPPLPLKQLPRSPRKTLKTPPPRSSSIAEIGIDTSSSSLASTFLQASPSIRKSSLTHQWSNLSVPAPFNETSEILSTPHKDSRSPGRPPRSARRPTDYSLSSTDGESGDEDEGYEVRVNCIESVGEMKWEITIRPGRASGPVLPVRLSTAPTRITAPKSATSLHLSLAFDEATGKLAVNQADATPKRRRTPVSDHTRANTFGAAGGRKLWSGLSVEEVEGSPSPLGSSLSLGTKSSHGDIHERIRPSTPPPVPRIPSLGAVVHTPTRHLDQLVSPRHIRTSSKDDKTWALSPGPSTPSGRKNPGTPRELTYTSPRSTPRRHRIVSASQLNGGLFAHGTVDGLSEELEGLGV